MYAMSLSVILATLATLGGTAIADKNLDTQKQKTQMQPEVIRVKIYRLVASNVDDAEILYDSTRKDIKDHNLTIPLTPKTKSSDYLKFRYYFECTSMEQPVKWVYEGHGMPHVHVTNERDIDLEDPMNTLKYTFNSKIWFRTGDDREESASGRYSCRSVQDLHPAAHKLVEVDVFFSGQREFLVDAVIESNMFHLPRNARLANDEIAITSSTSQTSHTKCRVVHLTVPVREDDVWVDLPCSVSKPFYRLRPKSNVLLYRVNFTSGEWRYLPLNASNLKYDPRTGFTVHRTLFKDSWNNSYFICASNQVKTLINITLVIQKTSKAVAIHPVYSSSSRQFLCVTWPDAAAAETNETDADTDTPMGRTLTTDVGAQSQVGTVPCYSALHCEFTRIGLQNYIKYQKHSHSPDSDDEREPPTAVLNPDSLTYEFTDSGLFYCMVPNASPNSLRLRAMYLYKLRNGWFPIGGLHESHDSLQSPLPEDLLQVGILPLDYDQEIDQDSGSVPDSNNTEVTFYCEGSRLFVAEPFVWKFVKFGDESAKGEDTSFKHGKMGPGRNYRVTVRSVISVDAYDMARYTRIECWAPVWNSDADWVRVAVNEQDIKSSSRRSSGCGARMRVSAQAELIRICWAFVTLTFQYVLACFWLTNACSCENAQSSKQSSRLL